SSRRRHTRFSRDWSSDVCSSDLKSSGVEEFEKAIETFQNWQKEILNSFAYNLHNGYIEGINNQTKVIKRNAFGYKRFDRFRLRVLLYHQYRNIQFRVG